MVWIVSCDEKKVVINIDCGCGDELDLFGEIEAVEVTDDGIILVMDDGSRPKIDFRDGLMMNSVLRFIMAPLYEERNELRKEIGQLKKQLKLRESQIPELQKMTERKAHLH